jgi:myxalamid-type nonribosomal peptide synthetase MxaA
MTDTSSKALMDERLARLTPQQRELLQRKLASGAPRQLSVPEAIAALGPYACGTPYPQSPAQQRIWFYERLQPGTGAYHMYDNYRLRGPLDMDAMRAAFAAVIARQAALRTGFSEVAGQPMLTVADSAPFALRMVDLSSLGDDVREAQAAKFVAEEMAIPFDLAAPPLMRATLVRMAPAEHLLIVVVHHIVADAWSLDVLGGEVKQVYHACVDGQDRALAPLPLQFPDVVRWQTGQAQQQRVERQLAYWKQALAGTTGILELPTDHPRGSTLSPAGASHRFSLPASLTARLHALARADNATLFMVMLAAFQSLLGRWSGQEDIVVGTPLANRGTEEFAPLVGLFVNTLALRADLSGEPSFRTLLARTRSHFVEALGNADAPLERIVDALQLERVPGRTSLFQVMFVQQAADAPAATGTRNLDWAPYHVAVTTSRFELTLSVNEAAGGIDAIIDYSTALFDGATIARLAEQLGALLQAAADAPDMPVARLPILEDAQTMELLALGDGGSAPVAAEATLYQLVVQQSLATPDAVAIAAPGVALSYRDLVLAANGVAARLIALGAQPETRVALLADRSADALVGLLGILAAGAAYVPLDPSYPDERLAFVLDDAAALALVAPPALAARAAQVAGGRTVLSTTQPGVEDAPAVATGPDHAAYVIYTSGSTGQPKGVTISHRNAMNLVQGFLATHDFSGQRLLMIPPLQFDASVGDIFPALAVGATLVLHAAPNELGPVELEQYCAAHGVTAIDAPAALLRRWTDGLALDTRQLPVLPELRLMMFGGEAVPLELVRRFARLTANRVMLTNHYGPTEASVCATILSTVDGAGFEGPELPIGRPLPGVQLYVLDQHLQLAPRGVVGELCIAGAGVARGYLNAPQLSAERFVPDPFTGDGARMYRTGDLVRWNSDGTLHFLGRRDHQVKLRGFRIELGDVETAISSYPGVHAAVASVSEIRPGDRRLVAFFVASDDVRAADLRAFLAARLPDAMLPAILERIAALPLTANGKVDRRALPRPSMDEVLARTLTAPATATEATMLAVWRELLGRAEISCDDEFFAVGGDSLLTLPLVFKLRTAFDVDVPLASVFAAPTIIALSRVVDDLLAGVAAPVLDLDALAVLPPEITPANCAPLRYPRAAPRSILITGATGFLGAYLMRDLLDATSAEMLCLVRARDAADGLRRVKANMETYGLWHAADAARIVPLPGDLATPMLGLGAAGFAALARRADVIFHNGGQVNFLAPYQNLAAANVDGTVEVLRLATSEHLKQVHVVSTLGVYVTEDHLDQTVFESSPPPAGASQHGGYNQSKWVGEQMALLARARGVPVALYRPARITGDSRNGCSNLGDYFNSWVKGCLQLGMVPHSAGDTFDMAPVDYVSAAIVRIALGGGDENGNFHFLNPHRLPVEELSATLRARGFVFDDVDYPTWRAALQAAVAVSRENALSTFAALFPEHSDGREPGFDCSATEQAAAACGITCPPADRTLFDTYVGFMLSRGYLPQGAAEEKCA